MVSARIGLGCMRLATEPDERAAAVLDAALAAGIDLFDTADAYAHDETEIGRGERQLAAALARFRRDGDGRPITVVTKGGLVRPGGAWMTDGRARHLAAAARASQQRLGAIDVYLLHAIDPRTPFATSLRALVRLPRDNVVRAIGLANVNATQLEEALAAGAPIAAVEVELNPWKLDALRGGLVALCAARGIAVLAHRPLGGPAGVRRAARDRVLVAIAQRLGATPPEVVLAWIASLGTVPLPGATRVETVESSVRASQLALPEDVRAELAAHFLDAAPVGAASGVAPVGVAPSGIASVGGAIGVGPVGVAPAPVGGAVDAAPIGAGVAGDAIGVAPDTIAPDDERELLLIMGMPASGKSTLAADYVARGYVRFNRDERGGSLAEIAREIGRALAAGTPKLVVDNTYASRASRAALVDVARRYGATVRVIHVATAIEDAQAHAASRILELHGRLLEPLELAKSKQVGVLAPRALFRWRRDYEPPRLEEGFASLETVVPARRARGTREATFFELDDLIWHGRPAHPDAIVLVDGARERVAACRERVLAGTTWQPGLGVDAIAALEARLAALLDRALTLLCCPHPAGPPICWCRKPLPGLALAFARAHDVDLSRSVHVGRSPADRGFARRAGMALELV